MAGSAFHLAILDERPRALGESDREQWVVHLPFFVKTASSGRGGLGHMDLRSTPKRVGHQSATSAVRRDLP